VALSACQHEWADVSIDQSGDENVFSCLKCGQRLVAGDLAAAVIKAEQELGVTNKLLPLGIIKVVGMPNTWTTEKPTQSGWYWWREVGYKEPSILMVDIVAQTVSLSGTDDNASLDGMVGGEWAGPLDPPA
jgi:hypothetical protein